MADTALRRPATAMPREYYVSPAIFEEELEKVLRQQWLLVGHANSLKVPGAYSVKQVGPESLIIARDPQGSLRAYYNVCRHRGYQILDDGSAGCAEGFVCPYHKWTYDNAGCLRRVPGAKDSREFDFADWSLREARITSYCGWLYVWLGLDEPPELAEILDQRTNAAMLDLIETDRLKLVHRETYIIAANWKAMMENDMECYHCGHGGHPSLAIACAYSGFFDDQYDPERPFPLREGMETFSMDGSTVCKVPLGRIFPSDTVLVSCSGRCSTGLYTLPTMPFRSSSRRWRSIGRISFANGMSMKTRSKVKTMTSTS